VLYDRLKVTRKLREVEPMATVYVRTERAREFRDLFSEWKRGNNNPSIIFVEPPEGPQVGEETQFVMVEDDFLSHMRTKGFPFRVG
jgi:hypothetical protein